jgi:hypothetical protein
MKKHLTIIILFFAGLCSQAQVAYFKGEWTTENKSDLFTCICKLEIKEKTVKAEFAWKYLAIDSTDAVMVEMYNNKKGKTGIEYANGTYNPATGDIYLKATELDDPNVILGMTIYNIKYAVDKKAIYGITNDFEGNNPGLFYAMAMDRSIGEKEFLSLKKSVK